MGEHLKAVPLGAGHTAKMVAIGFNFGCIVRDDDGFICDVGASPIWPGLVAPNARLVSVASDVAVLALYSDGSVWRMSPPAQTALLAHDTSGARLAAGSNNGQCLYFNDHGLDCYGAVVGDSLPDRIVPTALPELHAMAIAEWGELCGVLDQGRVHCWGPIQRPTWATILSDHSVEVPLAAPAKDVKSGAYDYSCALLQSGAVECWTWGREPVAHGIGWDDTGATELRTVDLGTAPGQ